MKKEWANFLRYSIGVFLIGVGIAVIGASKGEMPKIILGSLSVAVGLGIIFSKE